LKLIASALFIDYSFWAFLKENSKKNSSWNILKLIRIFTPRSRRTSRKISQSLDPDLSPNGCYYPSQRHNLVKMRSKVFSEARLNHFFNVIL
jgi:hypothetical protein